MAGYGRRMNERQTGIEWIFTWAEAVSRQRDRIMAADDLVMAQPDVMMFAAAIGGVLKTAALELGKSHEAIADFERQVPQGKDVRDIVSHLDAYTMGEGNLQKQGKAGRLVTLMRDTAGEIELTMFGYRLEVDSAARATADLAERVLNERDQREG